MQNMCLVRGVRTRLIGAPPTHAISRNCGSKPYALTAVNSSHRKLKVALGMLRTAHGGRRLVDQD